VLPFFLYLNRQGRVGVDVAVGTKGLAREQLPPASRGGAIVRGVLSAVAGVVLLAPPLLVAATAIAPEIAGARPSGLLGIFSELSADDLHALGRSARYGAAAAALDVGLAVLIALGLRRAAHAAALPVEFAVMLALALPGSAVAIALLGAFNAPSPLALGVPLGHTAAILILAYVIRFLPLAVRPARAALEAVGGELESAAAGLGAGRAQVLRRVTLPLIFPSLLAAFLICFIGGAGEFVASNLLFGVLSKPVSVRIAEMYRTLPGSAYALTLCLMLMTVLAVGVAGWLQRRRTG